VLGSLLAAVLAVALVQGLVLPSVEVMEQVLVPPMVRGSVAESACAWVQEMAVVSVQVLAAHLALASAQVLALMTAHDSALALALALEYALALAWERGLAAPSVPVLALASL